ncbi:MAG TPA: WXG100 family type VII secretion target [Streptosporangiaceae bacterium]|nr:WXG100 family type VII secretion target [Streptosporangiaceae bacterium]
MAAESAVNRAAMATAAKQVEDAVAQVRAGQSQLAGFHATLMAGWQGQAASAFTAAYEAFNADFTQVINALDEFYPKLTTTRSRYEANEETLTSSANRVASQINH